MSGGDGSTRLRVVCASANAGKVAEIQAILGDVVDLLPRPAGVPDVVENAGTLIGNARLKAQAISAASGLPAIADDTGLEVDALGGRPGVETAHFAGPSATDAENRAKLLAELAGLSERRARFRTIALLTWPDGAEVWAEGVCEGTIAAAERGKRGFGFDPVFVPAAGDGRTFAEMSIAEKQALSHRGRAFTELLATLPQSAGPEEDAPA
jgi:XTP/dITP diphosphohydrolase